MLNLAKAACSKSQIKYNSAVLKCIDILCLKNYSKQANVFNKILNKSSKKRKWHSHEFNIFNPGLPSIGSVTKGPESKKRVAVLNKLFMKHITDLMATGSSAELIVGHGIEITKVKVGSEYNVVNVYWTCHKEHREDETMTLLAQSASILRQELTSLRVIGKVPKINFVRDRSVQSWAAVEALLKTADMGDDFIPKGDDLLKNEFGNEKTELSDNGDFEEKISDLPPMRQNVFGVERMAIFNRIISKMRSRPLKKNENEIDNDSFLARSTSYKPFDEEAFAQFLLKRKILRDKLSKNEREEQDYSQIEYDDIEYTDHEDGDYLEEKEEER